MDECCGKSIARADGILRRDLVSGSFDILAVFMSMTQPFSPRVARSDGLASQIPPSKIGRNLRWSARWPLKHFVNFDRFVLVQLHHIGTAH